MDITYVIPLSAFLLIIATIFYFRGLSGPQIFFKGAVKASLVPGPRDYIDSLELEFSEKGTYQIAFLQVFSYDNMQVNQTIVVQQVPYKRKLHLGTFLRPIKVAITSSHVTETKKLY